MYLFRVETSSSYLIQPQAAALQPLSAVQVDTSAKASTRVVQAALLDVEKVVVQLEQRAVVLYAADLATDAPVDNVSLSYVSSCSQYSNN